METRKEKEQLREETPITSNTEKVTDAEKEKAVKEYIYGPSFNTVRMPWDNYRHPIERELIMLKETNIFISVMINFLWRQLSLAIGKRELQNKWMEEQENQSIYFVSDFPFSATISREIKRIDEIIVIQKKFIDAYTPKDFNKLKNDQNITSALEVSKYKLIINQCDDLKLFFKKTLLNIFTKFEKVKDCFNIVQQLLELQENYRVKIKEFNEINVCLAKDSVYTKVILGIEQQFYDIYMKCTAQELPQYIIKDNILRMREMVKITQKDINVFYDALYEFKLFDKAKVLFDKCDNNRPLLDDIYPIFFPEEKQEKLSLMKMLNEVSPRKLKQLNSINLNEVPEINEEETSEIDEEDESILKPPFMPMLTDDEINIFEKAVRKSFLEAGILAYKKEIKQLTIEGNQSKNSLAYTEEFMPPTTQEFKRRTKSSNDATKAKKITSFNISKALPRRTSSKLNENLLFHNKDEEHKIKQINIEISDKELTPPTRSRRHHTFAQKFSPKGKKEKTKTYTESSPSVSPPHSFRKITSSDNIKNPSQPIYNSSNSPISTKQEKGYLSLFSDDTNTKISPSLPKKSSSTKPIIYAEKTSKDKTSKMLPLPVYEKSQQPPLKQKPNLSRATSGKINTKNPFLEKSPKETVGNSKRVEITINNQLQYPKAVPQITRRKPITQTYDDNIKKKTKSSPDVLVKPSGKKINKEERRKSTHTSSHQFFQKPQTLPTSISQEIRIPFDVSDKSEEKQRSHAFKKK